MVGAKDTFYLKCRCVAVLSNHNPFSFHLHPVNRALSLTEFTNALIGMGFTKKFAEEIFRRADGDKNGEIDQMEFLDAMLLFVADYDDIMEAVGNVDDGDDGDDGVCLFSFICRFLRLRYLQNPI